MCILLISVFYLSIFCNASLFVCVVHQVFSEGLMSLFMHNINQILVTICICIMIRQPGCLLRNGIKCWPLNLGHCWVKPESCLQANELDDRTETAAENILPYLSYIAHENNIITLKKMALTADDPKDNPVVSIWGAHSQYTSAWHFVNTEHTHFSASTDCSGIKNLIIWFMTMSDLKLPTGVNVASLLIDCQFLKAEACLLPSVCWDTLHASVTLHRISGCRKWMDGCLLLFVWRGSMIQRSTTGTGTGRLEGNSLFSESSQTSRNNLTYQLSLTCHILFDACL